MHLFIRLPLVLALALVLGGIALWPTLFLPVVGWRSLQRAFGIEPVDQPSLGVQWFQLASVGFYLVKDTGIPLLTPLESTTEVWPMTASVSDAGLYLRAPSALGKSKQPILIPWIAAAIEPEARGATVISVLNRTVHLRLGGGLGAAVAGQMRMQVRRSPVGKGVDPRSTV